jgi:type 1 fimbria pilin
VLTTIPSLNVSFSGSCIDTVNRTQYVTTGSTVKASTCNVTTSSIQVPLLSGVSPTSLASTGATAGATRFSIGLNCTAPANAYLSLSDASDPTNRSTVLSAAPSSTTKGVGVQISSESTVLSFGPTTAEKGMTATLMTKMQAGANLIPLIARYVRTGPVSPGKLSAMATFTLSYQ